MQTAPHEDASEDITRRRDSLASGPPMPMVKSRPFALMAFSLNDSRTAEALDDLAQDTNPAAEKERAHLGDTPRTGAPRQARGRSRALAQSSWLMKIRAV